MRKIIASKTYNNGYGCSCCADSWNEHQWVNEDKYTKIKVLEMAIKERKNMGNTHLIKFMLEDSGKILFGFQCEIYRAGETLYWINEEGTKTKLVEYAESITVRQAIIKLGNKF